MAETKEKKQSPPKPKPDRRAQGLMGSAVTSKRNFRHPTGEAVVFDKYIRLTAWEDEQIRRVSNQIGMSEAGVIRMALYLFVEDNEKMSELYTKYKAEEEEKKEAERLETEAAKAEAEKEKVG